MADSSWGPHWPNCDRSHIKTLVRSDGLRLPIHHDLHEIVAILMDLTELRGYNIRPDWTWGYACRAIAGTNRASEHSQGTAIDINAPTNPRRRDRRFVSDMPGWMPDMWKAHGFRWGGDFSWPDPMHYEVAPGVSLSDMRVITNRLKRFLSSDTPAPRPRPRPTPLGDPVKERIKQVQRLVRVKDDGVIGPITNRAFSRHLIGWPEEVRRRTGRNVILHGNTHKNLVRWLQTQGRRKGFPMAVDGIVGSETNHLIVVLLHQRDGICGPRGYAEAVR